MNYLLLSFIFIIALCYCYILKQENFLYELEDLDLGVLKKGAISK